MSHRGRATSVVRVRSPRRRRSVDAGDSKAGRGYRNDDEEEETGAAGRGEEQEEGTPAVSAARRYLDQIVVGDNRTTLRQLPTGSADVVLSSPPYHLPKMRSSRIYGRPQKDGVGSEAEYVANTVALFRELARVVRQTGAILWNLSYGVERASLPEHVVMAVEAQTPWRLLDKITWNKHHARPMGLSPVFLTRTTEPIYVFGRKELDQKLTHHTHTNKPVTKLSSRAQQPFFGCEGFKNYIEARSSDGPSPLSATFSTDLVKQLMAMYGPPGGVVLDPHMGSGTTAIGARMCGMHFIGLELEPTYAAYAREWLDAHERGLPRPRPSVSQSPAARNNRRAFARAGLLDDDNAEDAGSTAAQSDSEFEDDE